MWEQAKALQEGAEIVVCTPVSMSWVQVASQPFLVWKGVGYWMEWPLNVVKKGREYSDNHNLWLWFYFDWVPRLAVY